MYHEPDIFLINPHSKCNSSNNNLYFIFHPPLLYDLSLIVAQLSMIIITLNLIVSLKDFTQFLTFLPRNTIYNACLVPKSCSQHLNPVIINVLELLLISDLVNQVRSIERTLEVDYVLLDTESFNNVFLNFCSGCC